MEPGFLPADFVAKIEHDHGAAGRSWLEALPRLTERLAADWHLSRGRPFPDLSYSYVLPATRADGTACVLKLCFPEEEQLSGIEALRIWGGHGAVRLLEASPADCAVLLERIEPGTSLADIAEIDEDKATFIAADLMATLWRPEPGDAGLLSLERWFRDLLEHRSRHGGAGRFSPALFSRAEDVTAELLASTAEPVVLHGDLHHFNILESKRDGWLAIDPKGLAGDRCFEIAAFLRNPEQLPPAVLSRRLDIFADRLALDRHRLRQWCFAEAMLNACWSHDEPAAFARKVEWAALMLEL